MEQSPVDQFKHPSLEETDERLALEAQQYFLAHPPLQLVAELLEIVRSEKPLWLTPQKLLDFCGVLPRMHLFEQRPDIRQQLLVTLTGAKSKTARCMPLGLQASMVSIALEAGDLTPEEYELAHAPADLAVYGDAGAIWRLFMDSILWEDDSPGNRSLIAKLIDALLKAGRKKTKHSPSGAILSSWDLMSGIDPQIWVQLPVELRVKQHKAWVVATRDGQEDEPSAFTPEDVFRIVPPSEFMQHLRLVDLHGILKVAETRMGFEAPPPPVEEPAPETRFEGSRSTKPPAALSAEPSQDGVKAGDTDVESLFSSDAEATAAATAATATEPTTPSSPPPENPTVRPPASETPADPMGAAPVADEAVGVKDDGPSAVIEVTGEELLGEHDMAPSSDASAIEVARMLLDLGKFQMQLDPKDPTKVRRVHKLVTSVLDGTFNRDEKSYAMNELPATKQAIREVLLTFDSIQYATDRYAKGQLTLGAFLARLEHHLGVKPEKNEDDASPASLTAPRPRATGRQSAIPPSTLPPAPESGQAKADETKPPAQG